MTMYSPDNPVLRRLGDQSDIAGSSSMTSWSLEDVQRLALFTSFLLEGTPEACKARQPLQSSPSPQKASMDHEDRLKIIERRVIDATNASHQSNVDIADFRKVGFRKIAETNVNVAELRNRVNNLERQLRDLSLMVEQHIARRESRSVAVKETPKSRKQKKPVSKRRRNSK